MLIQNESPAPAPAAVSGTSQKLLQLLRKRLRQLARVTFVLAIGLALAATALAIWWLTSLNGLPDIGEPFDVAAFRAFSIPDDQNAFTFLRRADEALPPMPGGTRAAGMSGVVSWSQADPKLREWVEANRQAIELFQQGADQSDAANPAGESVVNGQRLALFVLLEGDRRHGGRLRLLSRGPPHGNSHQAAGELTAASGSRRILERFPAATARDRGGRSEDHDPPAS
ncbi:MAG: hypothetical protein ACLP6E_06280 [Acidimicrobiales bacterium]